MINIKKDLPDANEEYLLGYCRTRKPQFFVFSTACFYDWYPKRDIVYSASFSYMSYWKYLPKRKSDATKSVDQELPKPQKKRLKLLSRS